MSDADILQLLVDRKCETSSTAHAIQVEDYRRVHSRRFRMIEGYANQQRHRSDMSVRFQGVLVIL